MKINNDIDMQIFYQQNRDSATVILEVVRGWGKKWQPEEQNIRSLLEKNFKKVNKYNTKENFWDGWNHLDRIILYPSSKKETHLHVYQGPEKKLKEILNFCKYHKISLHKGIRDNLREKYIHVHNKNIQELLKL